MASALGWLSPALLPLPSPPPHFLPLFLVNSELAFFSQVAFSPKSEQEETPENRADGEAPSEDSRSWTATLLLPLWASSSPLASAASHPAPWLHDATCSHTGHPILSSAQADVPPVAELHPFPRPAARVPAPLQVQQLTPAPQFLSTNCPTISCLHFLSSQDSEDWGHVIFILQLPWSQGSGNV